MYSLADSNFNIICLLLEGEVKAGQTLKDNRYILCKRVETETEVSRGWSEGNL